MKKLIVVFALLLVGGCAHSGVKLATQPVKPIDPVIQAKQDFFERYHFFITRIGTVSYYQESLGVTDKENKIFEGLKTIEEVNKFTEVFWKARDTDPNTPENEFKMLIDSRIENIKKEIFARDLSTPGLRFEGNGGLSSDLARVYLLHGEPHYKEVLLQNQFHVDLMVWYYFDLDGKPLFRFLFYNKYGLYRLFKDYGVTIDIDYLVDPSFSPLREISINISPTAQDLYDLWESLAYREPSQAFVAALLEFSYYSDVVIEGGDGNKRFGALDPIEPAVLTAEKYKPRILGEPEDLSGKEMLFGKYLSFIPAHFRLTKAVDGNPSLALIVLYQHLDWEIKDGKAESKLALNINVFSKETAESQQFSSILNITLANADDARAFKNVFILVDSFNGATSYGLTKFRDFAKKLSPGDYIIDMDLLDLRTMKSGINIKEFTK